MRFYLFYLRYYLEKGARLYKSSDVIEMQRPSYKMLYEEKTLSNL